MWLTGRTCCPACRSGGRNVSLEDAGVGFDGFASHQGAAVSRLVPTCSTGLWGTKRPADLPVQGLCCVV
jgi:hypothetical protein